MQTRSDARRDATRQDAAFPIDRDHLARQTLGDKALEAEVLAMFVGQIDEGEAALATAGEAERGRIAHALVGSARGIGAFALADCAAEIERRPADMEALARLSALAGELRAFIVTLQA